MSMLKHCCYYSHVCLSVDQLTSYTQSVKYIWLTPHGRRALGYIKLNYSTCIKLENRYIQYCVMYSFSYIHFCQKSCFVKGNRTIHRTHILRHGVTNILSFTYLHSDLFVDDCLQSRFLN